MNKYQNFHPLPNIKLDEINKKSHFLLFETSNLDNANSKSFIFTDPVDVISINSYDDVERTFEKIEKYSVDHYIAGYFSYELGYTFFDKIKVGKDTSFPLINLGVFDKVIEFDHLTGEMSPNDIFDSTSEVQKFKGAIDLRYNINQKEYNTKIDKVLNSIYHGDIYQTNFTFKGKFDFEGCPYSFYRNLVEKQSVSYSSFLKMDDEHILSLSPELFFRREGNIIESKPMKGTISRGRTLSEDSIQKELLLNSEKERAENTMIVDLIRNDIGKISEFGSVEVTKLFDIEKYQTLFQMTSTVKGKLKNDLSYYDIFEGMFPCGSVTGAPKLSAMQIIKNLENNDREVYCGAIGMIFPDKKCVFNVPIRTIKIKSGAADIGLGSGIVADSKNNSEYDECLLKSHFLVKSKKTFELIETLLWEKGNYVFLDEHLLRLQDSAEYFDFPYDIQKTANLFVDLVTEFDVDHKYKIRLTLDKFGKMDIDFSQINIEEDLIKKIIVSDFQTNSDDVFLFHKTTNRELYNSEYQKYKELGYYDVVFFNSSNELTEGTISNIILKKDGKYFTPPLSCGLLNGVFREHFIKTNQVEEKVIDKMLFESADEIFVCNSVRGMTKVTYQELK